MLRAGLRIGAVALGALFTKNGLGRVQQVGLTACRFGRLGQSVRASLDQLRKTGMSRLVRSSVPYVLTYGEVQADNFLVAS